MYLLDTNVLCERIKTKPDQGVIDFMDDTPTYQQFISVLTLGEIRKGIELLPDAEFKNKLISWLSNTLKQDLKNNIITIDLAVAEQWGMIQAKAKRTLPAIDALIAATALAHNLTLVTRNTKDFDIVGLHTLNPWYL